MRMMKRRFILLLLLFGCWQQSHAWPRPAADAGEIQLKLKKLTVLGSVLYLAAHPDDENTGVLAYLANEKCLRTAYLSLTRGDGGQNLIGAEQGDLLGVLRTQELLAARRIDGAEQFFTRAVDFGYSKSPEEALQIWGRDAVLADVVRVIRQFRPDVIITRFTPEVGGHGQHLASARLAELAFSLAGDPTQFPDQLTPGSGMQPWQPRRLFWDVWGPAIPSLNPDTIQLSVLDVGKFNPLLGKSYTEIAAESRSMHKCQGFGMSARRGIHPEYFQLTLGEPAGRDLFSGIDLSWERLAEKRAPTADSASVRSARIREVQTLLQKALDDFEPQNPAAILPTLLSVRKKLEALLPDFYVRAKMGELDELVRDCAALWMAAIAPDFRISPGDTTPVTVKIVNRSGYPLTVKRVQHPYAAAAGEPQPLPRNRPVEIALTLAVPADAPYSHPYWLRQSHNQGLFTVPEPQYIGRPVTPALPPVIVELQADGSDITFEIPLLYHWTDPIQGEKYRELAVVPPVTVNFENDLFVFAADLPKTVRFTLKAAKAPLNGTVRLIMPGGWVATKTEFPFQFDEKGQEMIHTVRINPPATPMRRRLTAEVEIAGRSQPARRFVQIDYDHVPIQLLFPPAEATLLRVRLNLGGKNIGYVMGAGDAVPEALAQIGYHVTLLSDEDLESANLSRYDAIVTGVRAYNVRERLKAIQPRLMAYVKNGGTLVVQYNTAHGLLTEDLGPYPFKISRDRVTREDAPVEFLQFDHPVLRRPNQILQPDFEGWVQERGLYFAGEWDPRYQPLLASRDPGESLKKGMLLYASYGKGHYFYTGISLFRQLPAGVAGAYKLFVNMLAIGAGQ